MKQINRVRTCKFLLIFDLLLFYLLFQFAVLLFLLILLICKYILEYSLWSRFKHIFALVPRTLCSVKSFVTLVHGKLPGAIRFIPISFCTRSEAEECRSCFHMIAGLTVVPRKEVYFRVPMFCFVFGVFSDTLIFLTQLIQSVSSFILSE